MVCSNCGLPDDLCVCDEVDESETNIDVYVEERKYNDVTILEGIQDYNGVDELESEIKKNLGCGGTIKEDHVELQGDQVDRVVDILEEKGFEVTVRE